MRVLDVIHGVLVAARFRQLEIEVQVLVVAAHQVEQPAGIVAHFIAQLAQRDELAVALAHWNLLGAAEQADELDQAHFQAVAGFAHGHQSAAHARHVAMMVGAQRRSTAEAALALVEVIGGSGAK
jgi:hypothetical protein